MKMKVVVLSGRGADAHVVHSNGLSRPFFVVTIPDILSRNC